MRDAGVLVGTLELAQLVDVDAGGAGIGLFRGAHDDTGRVDLIDDAGAPRRDCGAGIPGDGAFHARADDRRVRAQERDGLALHVRAHQRTVGVVILQEGNERRRDRHDLFGADIDHLDRLGLRHDIVAIDPARHEIGREAAILVEFRVRLGDRVAALFHRRQIDDLVGHLAIDEAAIWAFDEAVLIDPGIGRQRVDQTDIRAFRRFDRADTAIMGRMHVAHFEAGALAGQTARPQGRETPLVGDFRQRVGLIHELR